MWAEQATAAAVQGRVFWRIDGSLWGGGRQEVPGRTRRLAAAEACPARKLQLQLGRGRAGETASLGLPHCQDTLPA